MMMLSTCGLEEKHERTAYGAKDGIVRPKKLENIPTELTEYDQWVAWKAEFKNSGKINKIPVNPKTGINASTSNPETWVSYTDAVDYYHSHQGDGICGIGFVFTEDDPFCGIDLDECVDRDTGEIHADAKLIIDFMDSYTEISPSGTGVKIFTIGKLSGSGRNFGNVEIFDKGRYFTLTGEMLDCVSSEIKNRQFEIEDLIKEQEALKVPKKSSIDLDKLPVSPTMKTLISEGKPEGKRSEAVMKVLIALASSGVSDVDIFKIFEDNPIGEKYREKGESKRNWLNGEIQRAKDFTENQGSTYEYIAIDDPYTEVVDELNQKHAVVMLGGKCLIMNEMIDPVFNRHDITFSSISDFNSWYSTKKVKMPNGEKSKESVSKIWLDSERRRKYNGIVFSPDKHIDGYYNLYKGLAIKPKQGNWSLFKKHIHEVIASGNAEVSRYIHAWMAHLVQNPGGSKPGTSIVMRGKQGTGKGCFVSNFGAIFGTHYLHVTNQQQVTGKFNNHLKNALLVFCDEAIWAGDKSAEGILKGMVTEDTIMVEPKGRDAYPIKNHIRLMIASNNDWVVPAGMEERRFLVLDVSDRHMRDKEYFVPLFQQMDSGGREAMLFDLLHADISDVDLRTIPRTGALMDQIVNSMNPVEKFWYQRLKDGILIEDVDEEWEEKVECDKLYSDFIEFARNIGANYRIQSTVFGKQLKGLCPGLNRSRIKGSYNSRKWHYCFPSLQKCREAFVDQVKYEINWDE